MSGMEIPLAVAAGGAIAGSTIAGGNALGKSKDATLMAAQEQSHAQEFEAGQYDIQAKRIRSAAAADEAARRTDLASTLENIDVLRSGRGLSLDSPTGRAISQHVTSVGENNILTARTNYLLQAEQSSAQAELSRRKARMSLISGDLAGSAIDDQIIANYAGGVAKIAGVGMGFGKGKYGFTG
jgi:hypothetical protein